MKRYSEQIGLISSEESMVMTKFTALKAMMKLLVATVGIDSSVDQVMT